MKIKLYKKYSNKINESIMELKKVKPLFESTIDPGLINLDSYTKAFQDKGATDAILAEFKISKSLFEYLTLKKLPSNYDALMTVTNMPKKFFNINLSYDNKPEETIKKADDYASKYFNGIKFKISDLTDIKPENEAIDYNDLNSADYSNLDSLLILNEEPGDHGSYLFGDRRMNNKDLQNLHTEDKQKAVDASISNGSKKMKSVTTAIDNYIDNVVSSLKICIEEFSPNGAAALKEFDKAVNTLKSGAVNGEKIMEYIKHLDQNYKDLENAKLEKTEAELANADIIKNLMSEVLLKLLTDETFRNKCTKDVLAKLYKAKKKIEFLNILEKAGLALDESLTYNAANNVLNEADELNSEKFLDIDEIYDGSYTILKNALDPIFETARDEIKSVKKARELMETLLKKRSEEINNRIGAICRIGGNSKDIPGLSQLARTFLSSHPLRAEGLKNIWANHEIDLQNRMENRLNSLKSGEIMSYAEDFITNQIPRIIAMMLAYKTIARVLEVKNAHMSAAGVKKINEIKRDALTETNDLINKILESLSLFGSNITSPNGANLYLPDPSANTYVYDTTAAAQFDLNGKLGLFVQNVGFKDSQTFIDYVNGLNANITKPQDIAKIILEYAEKCGNLKSFVNDDTRLSNCLEIPQDSLSKITNYKTLLESVKIGDITDNKQIEGMKKLLAIAYKKGKEISSINASTLEGEIDRDKLAIVNGFDLAKLFTIDGSKEIVSQIYENAREMQLTDNFADVKDLVSVINIMTSLVNLITNKELLEAASSKFTDSLLRNFFDNIGAGDQDRVKNGIKSFAEKTEPSNEQINKDDIEKYLHNINDIITSYDDLKTKGSITDEISYPSEVGRDVNSIEKLFQDVYGVKMEKGNLYKGKTSDPILDDSIEVKDEKKYKSLEDALKALMQMLLAIIVANAKNKADDISKNLSEDDVNAVSNYFTLLNGNIWKSIISDSKNENEIKLTLKKIYSVAKKNSGKFTIDSVNDVKEINADIDSIVDNIDINKIFKIDESDGGKLVNNPLGFLDNGAPITDISKIKKLDAYNAGIFAANYVYGKDNNILSELLLKDIFKVENATPKNIVKCLTEIINVIVNIINNVNANAKDLSDIKSSVGRAYGENNYTYGYDPNSTTSIKNFLLAYVKIGNDYKKLLDENNSNDADYVNKLKNINTLKNKADTEFGKIITDIASTYNIKDIILKNITNTENKSGYKINWWFNSIFENSDDTNKLIENFKSINKGVNDELSYRFLNAFFEYIKKGGHIGGTNYIITFIECGMYYYESKDTQSVDSSKGGLNNSFIYYGNGTYIFENNVLKELNEDDSKSFFDKLKLGVTNMYNAIRNGINDSNLKERFDKINDALGEKNSKVDVVDSSTNISDSSTASNIPIITDPEEIRNFKVSWDKLGNWK